VTPAPLPATPAVTAAEAEPEIRARGTTGPIPLTQRKTVTASGEIAAHTRQDTPPAALAVAPTVQVRLAPDGTPLSEIQAPAVAAAPAPLLSLEREAAPERSTAPAVPATFDGALPELGPPPERKPIPAEPRASEPLMPPEPTAPPPRQKTPIPLQGRKTPIPRLKPPSGAHSTFDDLEADFFAREADLYKREAVETFEDLDHPLGSARTRRKK